MAFDPSTAQLDSTFDPDTATESPTPGFKAGDYLKGLKRGVLAVPGALTGLADIPIALATGERVAGPVADALGKATGFQPSKWAKETGETFSPGAKAAQAKIEEAWKGSGADRLGNALLGNFDDLPAAWKEADLAGAGKAIVENPGASALQVVESLPAMLAGGAIGKGVAVASKLAPAIAGAIGEGAITAGQQMDQTDAAVDPRRAAATSATAGALTGAIAGGMGRVAQKLGLEDIQTTMAGGKADATGLGRAGRLAGGTASEALQEIPQSAQEQVWQNVAEEKPLGEGVVRSAVEGGIAGGVMGAGANLRRPGTPLPPPGATAPGDIAEMDTLNAGLTQAGNDYAGQMPPNAGLLEEKPLVVQNPTTGVVTEIDRRGGPLEQAAAIAVESGAHEVAQNVDAGEVLFPYANPRAAQDYVGRQPDPEMYDVVPHPRVEGRTAVVPKTGPARQAILDKRAAGAANEQAKLRGEQLKQDESPAPTEITESIAGAFGNGSTGNVTITPQRGGGFEIRVSSSDGATKRSSVAGFPAGTNRAKAIAAATRSHGGFTKDKPVVKAKPVADTTVADAAQDELAPPTVQPVTDMPGVQQRAKAQAQGAVAKAQTRAAQLADEETVDTQAQAANPEPSEAQKAAGNYAHGHIRMGGLDISVETPAGATRTGMDKGKPWKVKNTAHYGYVKRSKGADGEQVDVYVKPGTSSTSEGPVFVVDQYNLDTGAFDEHKALLGYGNQAEAAAAYDSHFSDKTGPKRRGAVTPMSLAAFKGWLADGDTSKAVSGKRFGKAVADNEQAAQDEISRSTGKMSLPRSAQKPGESDAAFELRRAAVTQAAKTARVAGQQALPTKDGDKAGVREALGMPDDAEVSILSAESRPDAGKAKGVSKQAAQFVQQVARTFGKRVVFFDVPDRGAAEGFYVRGNTVYLNINSATQHLRVLGHELTHAMKRQARDSYEKMLGAVATLRTDEELAAQFNDYFGRPLDDVTLLDQPHPGSDGTLREFLAEEWMADLGGNRFAESEFWTSVFGRLEGQQGTEAAKGIVARLRLALVAALNKLKTLIGGNAFAVDARLGEHLEGIRTAVAEGFAEYARLSKAGQLADVAGEAKFKPGSDIGHKRESDGRYVGAPEWVGNSPQQLAVLRKKLLQLTLEGEPGRFWYEQSSKAILDLAKGDKEEAEKIVQLIAVYSPSAQVPGNTTQALKAYYQWKHGQPIRVGFGQADRKANALLYEGKEWKGMKTNTFYSNLMEEIDPSKNLDGATMDMWMAIAFDYGSSKLDQGPKYKFAERETQRIAKRLGWSPHQVQAAIWTAMKGRVDPIRGVLTAQELDNGWYDEESQAWWASGEKAKYESRRDAALRDRAASKRTPFARVDVGTEKLQPARRKDHYHLAHKLGMEYNLTQEDVTASKYDFSNAIGERTAQMSWEATPGETTGVLPGIHKAPMHQQQEYLVAIRKALSDEKGNDLIGKEVGLALATSVQGFSGWQGVSTVGIQDGIAVPIDTATSAVQQIAIDAINLVADIKGLVLYQEGVAWHFPHYKGSKNGQNGVEFRIGRLLTEDENANLYKGLVAALGHTYAPPIPTQDGQGFRVLNFPDEKFALMDDFGKSPEDQKRKKDLQKAQLEKNVAFIESVRKTVFKQPWHAEVTDEARFESIGELRENDWSKGDGDYRGRIAEANGRWPQTQDRWAGRSDILGWIEHDLRPRVAEVNRDFSERYGWGKASLSPQRGSTEEVDSPRFSASRAAAEIRKYAKDYGDDFFRTRKTSAKGVPEIAAAVAPTLTVREVNTGFGQQTADGDFYDPRADKMWSFTIEGEHREKGKYFHTAYIAQKNAAVWVNVGGLMAGDQGSRIYQIAGAYAHNNGLKLIGDPDGITEAGKRRRLENMISLALKYGTTKFMAPHDDMLGWNGLKWFPNQENLPFLLQASYNLTNTLYPEISDVRLNLDTGRFERAGSALGRSDFEGMASELRGRLGLDATGAPGSGTLRQAALFRTLVSQENAARGLGENPGDLPDRAESLRASLVEVKSSRQRTTDPYANPDIETRPGTTEEQRTLGRDALAALEQRLGRFRDSGGQGASLVGTRLYKSFVATGGARLVGQRVASNTDLAVLAQVYRDPRFETFRAIYTKQGKVVGETAYSSRLPGTVRLGPGITSDMRSDFERLGADGVYLVHNHPSGWSVPSPADIYLTQDIAKAVPMLGHVVIDHNEYSTIDADGTHEVVSAPELAGVKFTGDPAAPHPFLDRKIDGPPAVAAMAKELQAQNALDAPVLILTKGPWSEVDLIAKLPTALLGDLGIASGRAKAWLRSVGRTTGAGGYRFILVSDDTYQQYAKPLKKLLGDKLITDVVSASGASLMYNGVRAEFGAQDVFEALRDAKPVKMSTQRYSIERDEEDEGTFAVARDPSQKDADGDPLEVGRLHVPDEAVSSKGWRIGDIEVSPGSRRQGIASELIRRMTEELGVPVTGAVSVFSPDGKALFEAVRAAKKAKYTVPRTLNVDGVDRPTTNSKGKPIAQDEEGLRNFWRWFGDSKAVEAVNVDTGKPVESSREPRLLVPSVMYHTTRGDVAVFEAGRETRNSGTFGDWDVRRHAIFATPDLGASQEYGKVNGLVAKGANTLPLYAKAERPLDLTEGVSEEAEEKLVGAGMSPRVVIHLGRWDMFDDENGSAFVNAAKAAGYDSVIFNDENPETGEAFEAWALFDANQLKSAVGNTGTFSTENDDIRYSPPRFFSQLARTFENAPAKLQTQPAAQWKLWLAGQQAVKKDEIAWSGINDWLDLQGKAKVSRAQIQEYLAHNGVQLGEKVLDSETDADSWDVLDEEGFIVRRGFDTRAEAAEYADSLDDGRDYFFEPNRVNLTESGPRFDQYVLPGGQNYRELLITLPPKAPSFDEWLRQTGKDPDALSGLPDEVISVLRTNYSEAVKKRQDPNQKPSKVAFQSAHFDEPNILAHVRFNERIDTDDHKVMFLEELQSDWGQQGKRRGFIKRYRPEDIVAIPEESPEAVLPHFWYFRVPGNVLQIPMTKYPNQEDARKYVATKSASGVVEPGPFVTDTKAWTALALKRAILWAAQNGFSKVAWTTGEQQAERYDLSKQVDSISYGPAGEEKYDVVVQGPGGGARTVFRELGIGLPRIEEVLGKEIAKKMEAREGERAQGRTADAEWYRLSGLDLKVGGEGMKAYYDSIVPQVANDLLRKVGGGKVDDVRLGKTFEDYIAGRGIQEIEGRLTLRGSEMSRPLVDRQYRNDYPFGQQEQKGFTITPAMAAKVTNEGLPLFSLRRALNGEHNTDDHLVPETPLYLNNPDLVDLAYANGKPIRLNVGADNGPGSGRGALHLIATAEREKGRALDQVTDDEGENVVRTVLRVLGSGSASLHWQSGYGHALRFPLADKTLILKDNRDHYSLITMLPSARNKWGTSDWTGRLTFPVIADATSANPLYPAPANSSQTVLRGIGYSSEKFKVTPTAPLVQSPGASAPRIVVKVAQKKHRTLDVAAMAADGLGAKASWPRDKLVGAPVSFSLPRLEGLRRVGEGDRVDGRVVRKHIPNTDSIAASLDDYTSLGVREIPMSMFDSSYVGSINPKTVDNRTTALVDQIAESGELNPLIVAVDSKGAYIIEGGHRFDALILSDAKSIPALLVVDNTDPPAQAAVNYSPNRANLGALTPAQATAANNVLGTPKTFMQRLAEFRKDWAKNLKQGIFDQFAPIAELDQQAYIQARLSKGGESTLEALMLYGKLFVGADGATDVRYTKAAGKQGFAGKMAALKGEHDRFLLWVAAQRADRLQAIGLENLWTPQDIVTLKELDQGAMKDGTARPALYAQALQDLNEFNDNVLDVAVSSGLIDDATRQMYAGTPYVPFYRLQEDDSVSGFGIKPGLVNQYAWKKLKGGTQKLNEDLLANLLHNWSHLITASAKNRAAKATLDAAVTTGIAAQVPAGMPGKGHVSYKAAGQEQVFVVSDPHLFDAVAALHYAGLGPWAKPLAAAKHWLTIGVTANPAFKLRNLIRDSIGALGAAQLSYNVAGNLQQGWQATAEDSETRAHLLASGGMIRFGSMLDGKDSQRAADLIHEGVDPAMILDNDAKIKKFWKRYVHPALSAYNELGDRTENLNRAALYEQLIAKGLTNAEAAYWSRDLMDFAMSGKWTAIRTLTQTVPFFNARLQGLYKLGRAGKQDIRRLGTVLGAVSLSSLALLLAYGDDDDWKKRSDSDRNNYWWFKVGGHAFRLPKPFEIGAVGTLAERGYELMFEKEMTDARFGRNMRDIVMSQLSMNPVPQLFKPMMDIYANKDAFTGQAIESMGMERLRKEDRYDERTSEVARFLGGLGLPDVTQLVMGRWDTLSPKQVDFLARGYFSWLGTMTTTALDYGIRPMLDRGAKPERQLKDVFFAGNFVETLPSNQSRYLTQLYDQAREIEQAYASYHHLLKLGDLEGAKEIREEEGDLIKRYPATQQLKRAESLMGQQLQRINASTTLSGEEKRVRLDQVYARRNALAERFQAQ